MSDIERDDEPVEERLRADLVSRARKVVDEIENRRIPSAPQLRVVRRKIAAARELLALVDQHIETVHALAYDRKMAADRLAVEGGPHDYALDTNGDPRARELYTQAALQTTDLIELLTIPAHAIVRFMKGDTRTPGTTTRRPTAATCTADEVAEAIARQQLRIANGESEPPTEPQPQVKARTLVEITTELTNLRHAVAKTHPRLTKAERGRLTTLEQVAWRTAAASKDKPKGSTDDDPAAETSDRIEKTITATPEARAHMLERMPKPIEGGAAV